MPIVASERAGRSPAKRCRGAKEDFLRRLLLRVVGQGEDGERNEDDGSESEPPQNIIGAGGGACGGGCCALWSRLKVSQDADYCPSYYKVQDLGTLGGSRSWASAINDSGQVVGYSYLAGDQNYHAFFYKDAKMTDLGTLGGTSSVAKGINKSGQIVGWSDNSSGERHAFLYDSTNGMKDLNDLIPADSGWTIHEARAINNYGQIAATGYKEGVGQHALLLSPTSDIPPPEDTEAPAAPTITSPQNNSYDTDGFFSVSGSAEAASTVELFEGTTSRGATKADSSSGAWSIDLSGLSEGAHTYFAKATDAAGNTSSVSNSVTVKVDTTQPMVNSKTPLSGATNVGRDTNLTATFSEKMGPPPSIRPPSSSSRSTPMAPRRRSLTWL